MMRWKRRSDRSGRAPLPSPGRPPVAGRNELIRFWAAIAADNRVICSMSRSGSVDNAAMESFFSSLKTERTGPKTYRTRDEARADVFDDIERFCNLKRRHSTIGYLSPMEFERQAGIALTGVIQTRCRPHTCCYASEN